MKTRAFVLIGTLCVVAAACASSSTPASTTGGIEGAATTHGTALTTAADSYRSWCSACHGPFGDGVPGGSAIIDVAQRFDSTSLSDVISNGFGTMPGTPGIPSEEIALIVEYVLNDFSVAP